MPKAYASEVTIVQGPLNSKYMVSQIVTLDHFESLYLHKIPEFVYMIVTEIVGNTYGEASTLASSCLNMITSDP